MWTASSGSRSAMPSTLAGAAAASSRNAVRTSPPASSQRCGWMAGAIVQQTPWPPTAIPAFGGCPYAGARCGAEVLHRRDGQVARADGVHGGAGQLVLAGTLDRRCDPKRFLFAQTLRDLGVLHLFRLVQPGPRIGAV